MHDGAVNGTWNVLLVILNTPVLSMMPWALLNKKRKETSFDEESQSDESHSTVHFKTDPIKHNRGNDEDLWTNML